MYGFHTNRKAVKEEKSCISIYFFKKLHYLNGLTTGKIIWYLKRTNKECGSISFISDIRNLTSPLLKLVFTVTSHYDGKQRVIEQKINLLTTYCNFGGKRYWFECSKCSRRVGILCMSSEDYYFYCRHCLNLSYSDRNYDHRWRLYWQMRNAEEKRNNLVNSIKRTHYDNKPTIKYQRYLKYRQKEEDGLRMWAPFYCRMLQRISRIF